MSRTLAHVSGPALRIPERIQSLSEAHTERGDQLARREQFRAARKQFRTALAIDPASASARIGLARAWEDDPYGSDERAFGQYRRAAKLSATPMNLARLGRAALRIGRRDLANDAMKRALRKEPDGRALAVVVDALREAGRLKAAWKVACRARFRSPQDRGVQQLWQRVRFDLTAQRGPKKCCNSSGVVPFLRLVNDEVPASILRFDSVSTQQPHL